MGSVKWRNLFARIECVRDLYRACAYRGISKFGSERFCFFVMEMVNEEGKKEWLKITGHIVCKEKQPADFQFALKIYFCEFVELYRSSILLTFC